MRISAGEFKAKCLKLMDNVQKLQKEIIVTKFGRPVAKLVPYRDEPSRPVLGFMKGSLTITGDIVSPLDEKWSVDE